MKKVLLSLSMLAATVFAANAQNFKIWNAADGTGFDHAGTPYIFAPGGSSFTLDTAAAAPHVITAAGVAGNNCGETLDGPCYYINGFGNGAYAETGEITPFGYTAANFATDKFFMEINAPATKVKVQFTISTLTNPNNKYGYEFDLSATGNAYSIQSVPMSSFKLIVGNDPTGVALTSVLAANITAFEMTLVKTDGGGVGAASLKVKNMTIGSSTALSTASAASNIASTVVFPNPTIGSDFTARISLKNNASVKVILSDLTGRQISTQSTDANGEATFKTAGLVAGMYTVTYVLDGTPAKTELVVVK